MKLVYTPNDPEWSSLFYTAHSLRNGLYRGSDFAPMPSPQKVTRMVRVTTDDARRILRMIDSYVELYKATCFIGVTECGAPFVYISDNNSSRGTWNLYQRGREIARKHALHIERFYSEQQS